jgi:exodeoxyribonuclease VII small subunit
VSAAVEPESIGYAEAKAELDSILVELERSDVDVDALATHVARAKHLIELCRDRIAGARMAVDSIVADLTTLDGDSPSARDADPDGAS